MNEAVRIPVVADCDNGYGNVHNVIRLVKEYERAGIAGISIEDNPFPKKCSLYPGERQELVDKDEMAGRIAAAKSTQVSPAFFVIARTEALIAGLGMEEALGRAAAYEAAGADAILIHSRQATPDEIRVFAERWKGTAPLVVVPTKYPDVTLKELGAMGIRMVIFANQALRASIVAMRATLAKMRRSGLRSVQADIAPLDEVFRLVGQPGLEADDERFLKKFKKGPSAVIVAAGFEKNFWPLNSDRPKAMLEIRGKSILERQTELLKRCGVDRVAVVTGYKDDRVRLPGIVKFRNPRYRDTGMLYSLFRAESQMAGKFIFLYGDVLFDALVVEKLLKTRHDITLIVQRSTPKHPLLNGRKKAERDWVVTREEGGAVQISQIGHRIGAERANGEFAGIAYFSQAGAQKFRGAYRRMPPAARDGQFTDLIQALIDRGQKVHALAITGGWIDIDSFEDYQKAWETVRP